MRDDARGVRGGAKAQPLERRLKQRAVLEAVAAAAIDDHLSGNAVEVDADAAAEQHVHVLERNARDVRAGQTGERLERRLDRPRRNPMRARYASRLKSSTDKSIESTP